MLLLTMNIQNLQAEINAIYQEAAEIDSSVAQDVVKRLLNIIERLAGENESQKIEVQELRDEINRLKGEQGKPDIKANKKQKADISSEAERKEAEGNANKDTEIGDYDTATKKKRNRESKQSKVKIDREQICALNKDNLPNDLVFKGYSDYVIQNIIITSDNVKYRREVFYSPSTHKSYLGELPEEVRGQGEYGLGIRTLIPVLKTECNMSEKRIVGFFQNVGINVSPTYLSQQWTSGYDIFHLEKSDLYRTGIIESDSIQIDDTGARVNGMNYYCQIVCSSLFTAYFTTLKKDRLSVLDVLTDFSPPQYLYNQHAQKLLTTFKLTGKALVSIDSQLPFDAVMSDTEFKVHLSCLKTLSHRQVIHLTEACAIAHYQQQTEFPVIDILLSDNAPQFKLITQWHGLCWVHDGRHYKKLNPLIPIHQQALANFSSLYWEYYTELLKFKLHPTVARKLTLETEFIELFSMTTGYKDLDERIAKTLDKKTELLLVLNFPKLPLHNNEAELAARVQARSRDTSYQTRSDPGTSIKDVFMSINQTAKKLGVSFYAYVHDRVTGKYELPSLTELMIQKAQSARVCS